MDSDTERLLEYLDNDDYDGARNYAERHACERREHESGNPDCW